MLKKLINDESGVSAIDILVTIVVGVLLVIIAFVGIRSGVSDASNFLGTKIKNSVTNSGATW